MNFRNIRTWRLLGAVVVVFGATIWLVGYHPWEFKGGLGIRDSGVLSYPRYHAYIGKVELPLAGEYRFTVRGLPSTTLALELQAANATQDDRMELTSLTTQVAVSISDSSGRELCKATGRLSDATTRGLNSWVLASSSTDASFWHPSCQGMPFSRFKTYTVTARLSDVDPHSPQRGLMLLLQGGGNELP
jgi:hypothetical protein